MPRWRLESRMEPVRSRAKDRGQNWTRHFAHASTKCGRTFLGVRGRRWRVGSLSSVPPARSLPQAIFNGKIRPKSSSPLLYSDGVSEWVSWRCRVGLTARVTTGRQILEQGRVATRKLPTCRIEGSQETAGPCQPRAFISSRSCRR